MAWEPAAIVASLWLASGMTFASILYRRGADGWRWMPVCAVAGPAAVLLLADRARAVDRHDGATRLHDIGEDRHARR